MTFTRRDATITLDYYVYMEVVVLHCNPAEINEVIITGSGLTIEKAVAVARFGAHVSVADSAVAAMRKSRALVEKILDENRCIFRSQPQSDCPQYDTIQGIYRAGSHIRPV